MRQRFCRVCRGWHDVQAWPPNCLPTGPAVSDLPAPHCISDAMDAVQSQLDGKFYDSKSALRRTYHAAGVVEVGNDSSVSKPACKTRQPDHSGIKASVARAFSQAGLGA